MDQRRVVIVEDDPMTRGLLTELLTQGGFDATPAASASEAQTACQENDPDGVILDIELGPGPNGFDVADALLRRWPHLAVLFLTNLPDSRFAGRNPETLPAGVAYLRKEQLVQPGLLVETVDAVLRGDAAVRDDRDPDRPMAGVSRTQVEVLRMVAMGMSNQQIALKRNTSARAVHDVIARALAAIGEDDSAEGSARVRAARSYMTAAGIPVGSP